MLSPLFRSKQFKEGAYWLTGVYNEVNDRSQTQARRRNAPLINKASLTFGAPGYPPPRQIIRAHLQLYAVAFYNSYIVEAELAGNIRGDDMPVGELNFEVCVRQALYYLAFGLYNVVLRQNPYSSDCSFCSLFFKVFKK